MMNDIDRNSLISYRIDQSKDNIELSRFLINSGNYAVAVNRIYYGMYYALTALAIKHSFETSKHLQLIGWFNKEFVSTQISDKRFGKILRLAFQNRTKGDYDAFVEFTSDEVEMMYLEMIEFINEIEKLIKD